MRVALELREVAKGFVAGIGNCLARADALRSVNLTIEENEIVGVVGDRGAGKSTLLFCAAGLLVPDAGAVRWFGDDRRSVAQRRATYYSARWPATPPSTRPQYDAPHLRLIDSPEALAPEALARLTRWMERRRAAGDAILIATRDANLARQLTQRAIELKAGRAQPFTTQPRAARVAERAADVVSGRGTM